MKRKPGEWFGPTSRKPPPEHGIKLKKAGTTWWGQHWIEALTSVLGGDAGRLARGRTYARAGRVHDLTVVEGKVEAKVTGSRSEPYAVTIQLVRFDDASWQAAIAALAGRAQFSAELLAGQMPTHIDDAFTGRGSSLFPRRRSDLKTKCSCPDWGDPCKHVAATHYVLGEALDRDPFLLFELRGRSREQVFEALRAARVPEGAAPPSSDEHTPSVSLGSLTYAEYDAPRAPLPALHFSFEAPTVPGAVLKQLGAPAAWQAAQSPGDVLAPLVQRAARIARDIALADQPGEGAEQERAPPDPGAG